MNQEVKASTVLLILAIFGGFLAAKFWAVGESKSIKVFSYMHKHPDGSSFIKLNDRLFGFDNNGEPIKTINLSDLGVREGNASDFAFFSNGDLLVRRQSKNKNFIENLQRFFRFANPTEYISQNSQDGLYRCDLKASTCQAFTEQPLNLNEAFALAIDWQTDRVFVADSSRHQIYMYSSQGKELDRRDGFLFPNQLEVAEYTLYIADTNHHRLIGLDIGHNSFGEVREEFDTRTPKSRLQSEVWPAAFLLRSNQRWVINKDNAMNYGGVYIFDTQGKFLSKLTLPDKADPFALMSIGNEIVLSDYSQDRIYRFSQKGAFLGNFISPVFKPIQDELSSRRLYYQELDNLFSLLFAACLVIGFIIAFYLQQQDKKPKEAEHKIMESPVTSMTERIGMNWVTPSTSFKSITILLVVSIVSLFVLLGFLFRFAGFDWSVFITQVWLFVTTGLILIVFQLLQLRWKIGVTESSVVLYTPLGKKLICHKKSIIFNEDTIVIGSSVLKMNKLFNLFSDSDIEDYLYPAIKQGQEVNRQQMQTILAKNPNIKILRASIGIILVGMFIYYGVVRS